MKSPYRTITLGQIHDVISKLGGEEGVRRFLRGELVVRELTTPCDPGSWKQVQCGSNKTGEEYIQEIRKAGMHVGASALYCLRAPGFVSVSEPSELEVVIYSVAELGFDKGALYAEITEQLQHSDEWQLEPCPAEAAPLLRIAYEEQPYDEALFICMQPIVLRNGEHYVFSLERDQSGMWLRAMVISEQRRVHPETRVIFAKRKMKAPEIVAEEVVPVA